MDLWKEVLYMPNDEIMMLKDRIVSQLAHLKVYLFGSYAYGNPSPHSDYDFYTVSAMDYGISITQ